MLERVHIKNFRCLRDVELELEPLTILVGPNASGKSALLDALRADTTITGDDVWQQRKGANVSRRYYHSNGDYFERTKDGSEYSSGGDLDPKKLKYQKLQLDLDQLRSSNKADRAEQLHLTGRNLTNVFATLTRDEQISVRDEFCRLVPVYDDINTEPVAEGRLELKFHDRWDSELAYRPNRVSDGTMLVLAYLVLQFQKEPPDILAVEEPERGLHPYLLGELVSFFRELATGQRGPKPFNMVLATHSAQLLDYAEPEEVRLLHRDPDTGETLIETLPADQPDWDEKMDQYLNSLGDAWLSGGVGGVPGRG